MNMNLKIGKDSSDLVAIMRKRRGQFTLSENNSNDSGPKRKSQQTSKGNMYDNFLEKYKNLDKYIDSFKTRDLAYYFKKVSEDAGYRYVISNIQKDMHIFKVLMQSYDVREICGMIEFLFNSDQDYLDKDRLSPNILASRWINTVYADFKLWVDDKYVPRKKQKYQKKEWTAPIEESSTKIGEW